MGKYYETTANLNIRDLGDVIETAPKGTLLTIRENIWHEVELENGGYALASGKYLKPYAGKVEGPPPVLPVSKEPAWLTIARGELGVKEIPGIGDNPRIIEYHQTCTLKATEDSIAWCSAFTNFCITQAGLKGTNSAAAISWATWGQAVRIANARPGDVAVFSRTGGNHVGFYLSHDSAAVKLLGGNQGDEVSVAYYDIARLIAVRRPA